MENRKNLKIDVEVVIHLLETMNENICRQANFNTKVAFGEEEDKDNFGINFYNGAVAEGMRISLLLGRTIDLFKSELSDRA